MLRIFQKSPEQIEKEQRNQKTMSAISEEQHRKPSPLGDNVFPNHNFIDFVVTQDQKPITLHVYRYPPIQGNTDSEPKSIVIIFHGLNAHVGNYAHIAKELATQLQCVVIGFDHRGFGRSQGFPGLIESSQQHFQDCEIFLDKVRKYYRNLFNKDFPIILMGQSLGGMTAYNLALKGQPWVIGTILLAPAIQDNKDKAGIPKALVRTFGGLFPRLLFINEKPGQASKNPQISDNNSLDPYVYKGKIVPGTIKIILDCMHASSQTFNQFKTPFLVVMGGLDKFIDPYVATNLMNQSPATDKTMIFKDNMWHNVIMEEEIVEIIPEILKWVKQRT